MKKNQRLIGWQLGALRLLLLVVGLGGLRAYTAVEPVYAQAVTPDAAAHQLYLPLIKQ